MRQRLEAAIRSRDLIVLRASAVGTVGDRSMPLASSDAGMGNAKPVVFAREIARVAELVRRRTVSASAVVRLAAVDCKHTNYRGRIEGTLRAPFGALHQTADSGGGT